MRRRRTAKTDASSRRMLRTAVVAVAVAAALPAAPAVARSSPAESPSPHVRQQLTGDTLRAHSAASAARVAGSKPPDVNLEPCEQAGPDGLCGTLPVPLDRAHPSRGTVPIFFLYYPSRGAEPAREAILVTAGGPGFSLINDPGGLQYHRDVFDPLLDTRALIFLDQRGVGNSNAIDCPQIQHGSDDPVRDIAACGAQLGPDASLYTSGEVALDIEAVRKALRIRKLDFYGGSYAAVDIQSYAVRFPKRLRSAVLDSPATVFPFDFEGPTVGAINRAVRLICARSQSCSADHRDALEDVAWLARRVRREPVEGVGLDAVGEPHELRVTEGFLVWRILNTDAGAFVSVSEIAAAAAALRDSDDPAPLLRLAAEGDGPLLLDEGEPTSFSAGHNNARYCTDQPMPWDKDDSFDERLEQWLDARAQLRRDSFAPFSIDGWLAPSPIGPLGPDLCIAWPAPRPRGEPPLPRGSGFPRKVPALVLSGDLDFTTPTAEALGVVQAWRNSRFVEFADSGHHTMVNSRFECSGSIVVNFIAELSPGDTACADDTRFGIPAVGRFPLDASDARAAHPAAGDESTRTDRKVVTVVAATVTDSFRRTFLGFPPAPGVGLRGGSFSYEVDAEGTALNGDLEGARLARDVAVSGSASYAFETEAIDATVTIDGPGGEDGRLHVTGAWFGVSHEATVLEVTGELGGRAVSATVPAD